MVISDSVALSQPPAYAAGCGD